MSCWLRRYTCHSWFSIATSIAEVLLPHLLDRLGDLAMALRGVVDQREPRHVGARGVAGLLQHRARRLRIEDRRVQALVAGDAVGNEVGARRLVAARHVVDQRLPVDRERQRAPQLRIVERRRLGVDPEEVHRAVGGPTEVVEPFEVVHELGRQRRVAADPVELAGAVEIERGVVALDQRTADLLDLDRGGVPVPRVLLELVEVAEVVLLEQVGTVGDDVLGPRPQRRLDALGGESFDHVARHRQQRVVGDERSEVRHRPREPGLERQIVERAHADDRAVGDLHRQLRVGGRGGAAELAAERPSRVSTAFCAQPGKLAGLAAQVDERARLGPVGELDAIDRHHLFEEGGDALRGRVLLTRLPLDAPDPQRSLMEGGAVAQHVEHRAVLGGGLRIEEALPRPLEVVRGERLSIRPGRLAQVERVHGSIVGDVPAPRDVGHRLEVLRMNLRQTREHVPHQRAARRVRQHVGVEPLGLARVVDPQHVGRVRRLGGAEVAGSGPAREQAAGDQEEEVLRRAVKEERRRSRSRTAAGTSRSTHESSTLTGRAGPCNAARRGAASEPRGVERSQDRPPISDAEHRDAGTPCADVRGHQVRAAVAVDVGDLEPPRSQSGARSLGRQEGPVADAEEDREIVRRLMQEEEIGHAVEIDVGGTPRRVGKVAVTIPGAARSNATLPIAEQDRHVGADGEAVRRRRRRPPDRRRRRDRSRPPRSREVGRSAG